MVRDQHRSTPHKSVRLLIIIVIAGISIFARPSNSHEPLSLLILTVILMAHPLIHLAHLKYEEFLTLMLEMVLTTLLVAMNPGQTLFLWLYWIAVYRAGRIRSIWWALLIYAIVCGAMVIGVWWWHFQGGISLASLNTFEETNGIGVLVGLLAVFGLGVVVRQEQDTADSLRQLWNHSQSQQHHLEQAYDQLIQYVSQIEKLRPIEDRAHIANILHDSLGHSLTAVIRGTEACMHLQESPNQDSQEQLRLTLRAVHDMARDSLGQMRHVVRDLHEVFPAENRGSFLLALQELASKVTLSTGAAIILQGAVTCEPEYQATLYFCIQEAITNALQHGHATTINVTMSDNGIDHTVTIKDNGSGAIQWAPSYGMHGIQTKMHALQGMAHFISDRGEGFTVILQWRDSGGSTVSH